MKVTALIKNNRTKEPFEQEFEVESIQTAEQEIIGIIEFYNKKFGGENPRSLVEITHPKTKPSDAAMKARLKRGSDQIKFLQNSLLHRDEIIKDLHEKVDILSDKIKFFASAIEKGCDAKDLFNKEVAKYLVIEYEIRILEQIMDKTPVRYWIRKWIFKSIVNDRIKKLRKLIK